MGEGLTAYIERLELMAFFAGYPLIYLIVKFIVAEQKKPKAFVSRMDKLLPYAYALTGTLFLSYVIKNISMELAEKNIADQIQLSYLKIWGLLTVLFWIPAISKKPVLSLLHSLVFFSLLLVDFFRYITSSSSLDEIKNDMNIYTNSLLLNTGALVCIFVFQIILSKIRHR